MSGIQDCDAWKSFRKSAGDKAGDKATEFYTLVPSQIWMGCVSWHLSIVQADSMPDYQQH